MAVCYLVGSCQAEGNQLQDVKIVASYTELTAAQQSFKAMIVQWNEQMISSQARLKQLSAEYRQHEIKLCQYRSEADTAHYLQHCNSDYNTAETEAERVRNTQLADAELDILAGLRLAINDIVNFRPIQTKRLQQLTQCLDQQPDSQLTPLSELVDDRDLKLPSFITADSVIFHHYQEDEDNCYPDNEIAERTVNFYFFITPVTLTSSS